MSPILEPYKQDRNLKLTKCISKMIDEKLNGYVVRFVKLKHGTEYEKIQNLKTFRCFVRSASRKGKLKAASSERQKKIDNMLYGKPNRFLFYSFPLTLTLRYSVCYKKQERNESK